MEENSNKVGRNALYDITHGKIIYAMAFVVPLIIMIAIFVTREIYPFGDNCYLRSDMYHQYCPFFSTLWEKIRTGGSLTYSWDIGLGSNFTAIFGYYLSSPINWFIALFPQKHLIEVMNIIILLKLAGSSLTCTIYLCKHNNKRHISAAMFGLFYGLSAFIAAYSWNLMWLDCVLLLPLVVLGLEKLVNEGKGLLYAITLGLTILSNYYISIMICISMVLYFIVLMISRKVPEDPMEYLKSIGRFILYSILAGALAAALLLPEMYALSYTASGDISFPETMSRYFSFITIIKRHFINMKVSTGLDHIPNIYCGVAILVLLPLYVMNKNITKREKIAKLCVLFIFFTAFNMNIPNFIWHGFHYPNSLPCRQSFIYIFLLLTMCYDAFINMKKYKDSQISGSFFGVLLLLIYIGNTLNDNDIDFRILYVTGFFIALYVILMFLYRHKRISANLILILVFAVSIVECTINMENTGYSTTSRSSYLSDYDRIDELNNEVESFDDSFYRTTKYRGYRSKNDAAWHHFKGASVFSSTAYAALTNFYGDLGLEHSTNSYAINGATPLVYSLFDIKYLYSNNEIDGDEVYSYVDRIDGTYLYQNNYALPLAYTAPSTFCFDFVVEDSNPNPFDVQNSLVYALSGVSNIMEPVEFENASPTITIMADKDEYLYAYCTNKQVEKIKVTVNGREETYSGINHGRTVDIGYVKAGSTITLQDAGSNGYDLQLSVNRLNTSQLKIMYERLSERALNIIDYDDTHIYGNITVDSDCTLVTTIPYDEGYTIYVDGKKTPYTSYAEKAFIALNLEAGAHDIEFKYSPRGFKPGIVISILSLLSIAGLIVFRIKTKKELTETGALKILLEKKSLKNDNNEETNNEKVEVE